MKEKKRWFSYWRVSVVSVLLLGLSILLLFYFISYNKKLNTGENNIVYDKYYAMISDNPGDKLWQSVFESAHLAGKESNSYVEYYAENFNQAFSSYELMEIAIGSGVDGIIISANESDEMTELINRAASVNIPVVTLYSDNTHSDRLSYVGIGNYNLGTEYGNLIAEVVHKRQYRGETIKVQVLIDAKSEDNGQNILYAAIQEAVEKENIQHAGKHQPIEIEVKSVDATNNFSVEESVRSIFAYRKSDLPDIVVCLNEIDTTSLYQAVVDYNAVGQVTILGYYDSESILKGIERGVIYATVSVDTDQMGKYCIEALDEYYETGNANQYYSADISIITKDNIDEYRGGEQDEE